MNLSWTLLMTFPRFMLAGLLALACGMGVGMPVAAETASALPTWVVVPSAAGEHLPPSGRSLFDQLFAVSRNGQSNIEIPFPFAALLNRLDSELVRDPGSLLPPAKRALIPLGRSLQRTAAAPDYFAFPRVVVAVDSESSASSKLFLKDRLYIGYQEKSSVLEVISYNESAGRFEFQLVKDYRAGSKPQVYYANRNLCFACHQNGSPIFSRALWDETNANPKIANLLAARGRDFYGIPPRRGVDIPYAIDNATERANGFALTQRLWREGCGDADLPARRCRAGLFIAALRHSLSGGQTWTPDHKFRQMVAKPLQTEASRRWPGGLASGNPDLPNRNPLDGMENWPEEHAARIGKSHVAARFDPLLPRQSRESWQPAAPGAINTLIAGLGEFVSATDRQELEMALVRETRVTKSVKSSPCRIERAASRWSLQCSPAQGQTGPTLNATVALKSGYPVSGQASRFALPGGTALSNLELFGSSENSGFTLHLNGRVPRTAEGHALDRLKFRPDKGNSDTGEVTLEIREDFAVVEQAVSSLLDSPQAEKLFGPTPFPRIDLFAALLASLGSFRPRPCCTTADALPPPRLEVPAAIPGNRASTPVEAGLQSFYPYCATCHQSAETFPPNFLTGSGPQVAARLRQCAPRLYVRLSMADLAPDHRDKTPMPPESMLPAFASDVSAWKNSPARNALLAQVGAWLSAENGHPPNIDELLANGYEALRPCLPTP
jgi:mono/diheme cytochrome c family protein